MLFRSHRLRTKVRKRKAWRFANTYKVGAGAVLLGLLVISPILARPVVGLIGLPFRLLRPSGRLAARNIVHNPRRTANTSGALMVGMALVCAGATLAASVDSSVFDVVDDSMKADFIVEPAVASVLTQLPADMVVQIEALDEVDTTTAYKAYVVSAAMPDGSQQPIVQVNIMTTDRKASCRERV